MDIVLKKAEEGDIDFIIELHNLCHPDWQISKDEVKYWEEHAIYKERWGRVLALMGDKPVGFGSYKFHPGIAPYNPEEMDIDICVHPEFRRKGIGTKILKWIEDEVRKKFMVKRLTAGAFSEEGVRFLKKHGFEETFREEIAYLELENIETEKLPDYTEHLSEKGIEIVTLEHEKDIEKFYKLNLEIWKTLVDHPPIHLFSFEEFMEYYINSPETNPASFFIAKFKERYIGEALMWKGQADPVPYINPVGVIREFQKEGFCKEISSALIIEAIKYAKLKDYREIKTWHTGNIPGIKKIYRSLGFRHRYTCVNFIKILKKRG